MTRPAGRPVALRLTLAFLGIAILGVLLVTLLTVLMGSGHISLLEQQQRQRLADSLTAVAAASYNTGHPSWSDVDLRPAVALAAVSHTGLVVLDQAGHVVVSSPGSPDGSTDGSTEILTRPIVVDGHQVGTAEVRFTGRALLAPIDGLRTALTQAVVGSAGVATLVALVVALIAAHRVTRRAARLVEWSRAMSRGDRDARVQLDRAPAELAELADTLNQMADSLAAEQLLRREQAADIAHELRRPIASLRATCEALADGVLPLDQPHVRSLHDLSLHLSGIVDDVQHLADLDVTAAPDLQVCDLAGIAESTANVWEANFAAAQVGFHRDLSRAMVATDPRRMRQVIANLLSNAVKYTPAGGQVRMSLITRGGQARLSVSDTGPGISSAERSHLYDRRWRGVGVAVTTRGDGIGLAVADALMRAMGGRIDVASQPGAGSTFTLAMPLAGTTGLASSATASVEKEDAYDAVGGE